MKLPLSLDTFLLLIVVPANVLIIGFAQFILVLILLLYLALELWHPIGSCAKLPKRFDKTRVTFLARWLLVLLIAVMSPVLLVMQRISIRHQADISGYDFEAAYTQLHDGAYQTEIALNYLLAGRNPYGEGYENTLVARYTLPETEINPAIDHWAYLPGLLYFSLPLRQLANVIVGFYDQRMLYLTAYLVTVLVLPLMAVRPERKLALSVGVGLNPLLVDTVANGLNDIVVIVFLILTTLLMLRKHVLWATLFFALACISKQSAWLVAPFYMLAVLLMLPVEVRAAQLVKVVIVLTVIVAISLGPFVAWDLGAFVDDAIRYTSGTSGGLNYPIRGFTFGALFLALGLVKSPLDYFPFWLLQLTLGIPLLIWCLHYQFRHERLPYMHIAAGFFILGFGFLSRFFQTNYLALVTTLLILGILLPSSIIGPEQSESGSMD